MVSRATRNASTLLKNMNQSSVTPTSFTHLDAGKLAKVGEFQRKVTGAALERASAYVLSRLHHLTDLVRLTGY